MLQKILEVTDNACKQTQFYSGAAKCLWGNEVQVQPWNKSMGMGENTEKREDNDPVTVKVKMVNKL